MNEISEKDVKRLWVEKDAVCVELKDGRIGRELIRDYEPLRKATRKQLENCRVDCDGVWFDDLDEGLELSGFFSDEKNSRPWCAGGFALLLAEFDFAERLVMVASVIDVAAAAIDEAVGSSVACEVINVGFVPSPLGQ